MSALVVLLQHCAVLSERTAANAESKYGTVYFSQRPRVGNAQLGQDGDPILLNVLSWRKPGITRDENTSCEHLQGQKEIKKVMLWTLTDLNEPQNWGNTQCSHYQYGIVLKSATVRIFHMVSYVIPHIWFTLGTDIFSWSTGMLII